MIHAETVGVLPKGVLQVVHLNLLQVLLPHHPPPAFFLLDGEKGSQEYLPEYPPVAMLKSV